MRQFATYYPDFEIVPQSVAQLPWGHISVLIHKVKDPSHKVKDPSHKVKDPSVRSWYAQQAIEEGWSRSSLERYMKGELYERQADSDYRRIHLACIKNLLLP